MRKLAFTLSMAMAVGGIGSTGLNAAAPAARDAEQPERKICRTTKMTGSLTRRTRICLTEAQWRELNDRTRRGLDEMIGSASGAPACISAVDAACGGPTGAGPQGTPGL